ncbi:trehalose synthase [Streptomyces sp. e14]|nr:trehalose synthase [Streptomyces sp. e14]
MVQACRLLRGPGPLLPGQQRRRHRRPEGPDRQTGLSAVAGRGLPVAAAVLQVAPQGRRLRRLRLHRGAARVRRPRRLRGVRGRRPPARHARHHRLRHEPHQRPAPVVPGVPQGPHRPLRRLLRLGRRRQAVPGRPDHLRRHRGVQLDLRPGARPVLLPPVLLSPAGPQLREPGRAGGDDLRAEVLAGPRHRRVPAGRGAVPVPEEGTNCENLPATHAFLKRVRKEIDAQYPDTVILAEANQWPEDVVDYFGDYTTGGDECHMAFHFPVMPRIFMAVRRESRYPVSEILAKTPAIPSSCQWGIFLRNHDELTLEMVTDEERDYMWAEYAKDPRMRANIGIRRRLAPLLDNDRNQIELFTALLLSLPGSPILYYGDEIGMGDNIWLGDRDAVRTPMQWTPDRNAGFSSSDPGRLFLPTIMDPVYGYQVTNVEASMSSPSSLLHWTRRMIEIRKQNLAFGLGSYRELPSSNPAVIAFLREYEDDLVLCVHNFSRFAQPTELDLSAFHGRHPVELFGGVRFPAIGELPYLLTMAGHGFYWFRLRKDATV